MELQVLKMIALMTVLVFTLANAAPVNDDSTGSSDASTDTCDGTTNATVATKILTNLHHQSDGIIDSLQDIYKKHSSVST